MARPETEEEGGACGEVEMRIGKAVLGERGQGEGRV